MPRTKNSSGGGSRFSKDTVCIPAKLTRSANVYVNNNPPYKLLSTTLSVLKGDEPFCVISTIDTHAQQ